MDTVIIFAYGVIFHFMDFFLFFLIFLWNVHLPFSKSGPRTVNKLLKQAKDIVYSSVDRCNTFLNSSLISITLVKLVDIQPLNPPITTFPNFKMVGIYFIAITVKSFYQYIRSTSPFSY